MKQTALREITPQGRLSVGTLIPLAIIALVVAISLFAVYQSISVQERAKHAFDGWLEDSTGYQQAVAEHNRTSKPMVVYFYATWCPHCKKLSQSILSTPEVQAYLQPFLKVRIAPDNGLTEKALMRQYGADGFPAFYLVTGEVPKTAVRIVPYNQTTGRYATPQDFIRSIKLAMAQKAEQKK